MSETLDINKNIWLWLTATKGISNYHSAFIDGSPNIDSWDEFPEFKNLVDNSDKFTAYQEAVLAKGSNFLKNFIRASMYPLFCKELKDIQQPTINQLYFDGGYVIGPKDDFLGTFDTLSLCQTIKINNDDFENYNFLFSLGAFGIRNFNDTIAFYIYKNTFTDAENFGFSLTYAKDKHPDELSADKTYTNYSLSAYTKILDGKFHTISLIFKAGEKLRLYVDGALIATSNLITPYSLVRGALNSDDYKYYSYGVGCRPAPTAPSALKSAQISDVAVFNFDITSKDVPYSIDDYQQGKPIPPEALNGFKVDLSSAVREAGTTANATYENGVFTLDGTTASSSAYVRVSVSFKAKKGDYIRIKNSAAVNTGESEGFGLAFRNDENASATPFLINLNVAGDTIIRLTRDITKIAIWGSIKTTGESGVPVGGSCELLIEKVGALLALENFTFDDKVLDYSGNNRNGTIRGVVGDPMTSLYGLGTLISILNLNPRFIELTKDDHNTYINNISNIMVNKDLNLRPHLNVLIKLLKDNESEVLSYVDNQGLADEYNGSTSDYEKLGFLFCALLKELRTIALEENLINY